MSRIKVLLKALKYNNKLNSFNIQIERKDMSSSKYKAAGLKTCSGMGVFHRYLGTEKTSGHRGNSTSSDTEMPFYK